MKRLQKKINTMLFKLKALKTDLFFQSMPEREREMFYRALRRLGEFEDMLIIKYILKQNDKKEE